LAYNPKEFLGVITDSSLVMEHEPRTIHTAQCHEYSSLWKALRSEHMCQATVVLLPWYILMVKLPYHSGSDVDQLDHRDQHARP
jgi:hypothetical protein